MQLNDAWDLIATRKAEEAPGGIAPLNPSYTAPGYDPTQYTEPPPPGPAPVVTITASKIPPVPAPIQIPPLKLDPWDTSLMNRAAMVQRQQQSTFTRYLPWIAGAIGVVALVALLSDDRKRPAARRVSRKATS